MSTKEHTTRVIAAIDTMASIFRLHEDDLKTTMGSALGLDGSSYQLSYKRTGRIPGPSNESEVQVMEVEGTVRTVRPWHNNRAPTVAWHTYPHLAEDGNDGVNEPPIVAIRNKEEERPEGHASGGRLEHAVPQES